LHDKALRGMKPEALFGLAAAAAAESLKYIDFISARGSAPAEAILSRRN